MFILAHSSYLPTVFNKNFQAFNGIQDLVWGDTIRVRSVDAEYIYSVQKVYQAKASEVAVPATPGKAQLTLATCNSFGSKDDRFVVEATLIETKKL
jgi:LPXTG-site transpeptidase (sortase) family protein